MFRSTHWRSEVAATCLGMASVACGALAVPDLSSLNLSAIAGSLIRVAVEPAGANCADGGTRIDSGIDNGDGGAVASDGLLEDGEVDSTSYLCNGAEGSAGADGKSGHGDLLAVSDAGKQCASTGYRVDSGTDNGAMGETADDGILEAGEITSTSYVCNGTAGANGNDGAKGAAGATGATGANGNDGATGATGATGANGNDGAAGATGATGANGNDGATGATGASGANGNDGATGATGNDGATGATGATGANGNDGAAGATGATGANGNDGATGATGATGANGNDGATGATGANGNDGATGATGASGSDGATGSDGYNSLIRITPDNSTCVSNGYAIAAGLDNGDGGGTARDGVLQDGEVDSTGYLCSAPQ